MPGIGRTTPARNSSSRQQQGTGGAHQHTEGLAVVGGVEGDEAHPPENAVDHLGSDFVGHQMMGTVPPPEQYVGVLQHLVAQAAVRLILGGGAGLDSLQGIEIPGEMAMDAAGIQPGNLGIVFFVEILIPDGNANHSMSPPF